MIRTRILLPALALTALLLPACATTNLIEWSKGSPSQFNEPQPHQTTVVRAGGTIVVVSHALESVRNLCDRALWLEQGVIQREGPAEETVERYWDEVSERLAAVPGG